MYRRVSDVITSIKDIISNPQLNKYDVSSLKGTVMTAGQPFQPSTFQKIRKIMPHCKYVEYIWHDRNPSR